MKSSTGERESKVASGVASGGSGGAKPISYDTYSTDTSSQFSVDIVEVAPRGLELEEAISTSNNSNTNRKIVKLAELPEPLPFQRSQDGGESAVVEGNGGEIVLNASKLQVETET